MWCSVGTDCFSDVKPALHPCYRGSLVPRCRPFVGCAGLSGRLQPSRGGGFRLPLGGVGTGTRDALAHSSGQFRSSRPRLLLGLGCSRRCAPALVGRRALGQVPTRSPGFSGRVCAGGLRGLWWSEGCPGEGGRLLQETAGTANYSNYSHFKAMFPFTKDSLPIPQVPSPFEIAVRGEQRPGRCLQGAQRAALPACEGS